MEYVGRVPGCGWLAYIGKDENGGVGNGEEFFGEKREVGKEEGGGRASTIGTTGVAGDLGLVDGGTVGLVRMKKVGEGGWIGQRLGWSSPLSPCLLFAIHRVCCCPPAHAPLGGLLAELEMSLVPKLE
jgi:hypothetical protein